MDSSARAARGASQTRSKASAAARRGEVESDIVKECDTGKPPWDAAKHFAQREKGNSSFGLATHDLSVQVRRSWAGKVTRGRRPNFCHSERSEESTWIL